MGPDARGQGTLAEERLGFFLLKQINRAVREFDMIHPGDRIAVAVSGGKDSLSLMRLLHLRRQTAKDEYSLAAIHVLGDTTGVTTPHEPLRSWLQTQGVPFRVVMPEVTGNESLPLGCQRCTWLRRKALFTTAREMGCNVVAYAHHADDAAQTTLLNLLYGSAYRTIRPSSIYFGGEYRLIRPLFYVPETDLIRYARLCGFPPAPPLCPRSGDSRRRLVAGMLKTLGRDYLLNVRTNLIRAGLRTM